MQKGRLELIRHFPYLAHLLFSFRVEEQTLPVNFSIGEDWVIYLNKNTELTLQDAKYIWYKAASGALRRYKDRRMSREPNKWDKSCSIVTDCNAAKDIDYRLENPDDCFYFEQYKYEENIYENIKDKGNNSGQGPKSGGLFGNPQPWESKESEENKGLHKAISSITLNKAAGSEAGTLARYAKEALVEKIPWQTLLHSSIATQVSWLRGHSDYSMSNPKQKSNIIYPTLKDPVVRVSIIIDTSGSIGEEELNEFLSHTRDILSSLAIPRATVICWDCNLQSEQDINNIHKIDFKGGGGTNMMAAIKYASKTNCDIIVVFTDGECEWNNIEIRQKVILVISKNGIVPKVNFAEIIKT